MVMYPQLDAAEKYSQDKLTPAMEATPCLERLISPARARDSGNTILKKKFVGGSIYLVGANSAPSLRGTSGAVLLGDEVDSNEMNPEGDPVALLFKRGESFPNVVKVLASTPKNKGTSIIWGYFEESDQQYWFVPCVKCHQWQTLKWSQIVWPQGQPQKAELICSSCQAALNDSQRLEMYFAGEWRATAPFNGIAGFHLNGINCPWPAQKGFVNRLHQMASDHLTAVKKGEYTKQVWVNTFLVEPWEVETERIEPVKLIEGVEDYAPEALPNDVLLATAAVDVQKLWLQCEILGWGLDEETWGIETVKLPGDTEQDDVWNELAELLASTYLRRDGVRLSISAVAIDMRHRGHKVRSFRSRKGLPHVYCVHGKGGLESSSGLLVTSQFHKRYGIRTFSINTKRAKDTIFARLRMEEHGPRFMHFPNGQGYNDEYFSQLTAEVLRRERKKGVMTEYYEQIRERNEALDIRVYHLALLDPSVYRVNFRALSRNMKPPAPPKEYVLQPGIEPVTQQPEAKPAPLPRVQMPRMPRRGFVNGWK